MSRHRHNVFLSAQLRETRSLSKIDYDQRFRITRVLLSRIIYVFSSISTSDRLRSLWECFKVKKNMGILVFYSRAWPEKKTYTLYTESCSTFLWYIIYYRREFSLWYMTGEIWKLDEQTIRNEFLDYRERRRETERGYYGSEIRTFEGLTRISRQRYRVAFRHFFLGGGAETLSIKESLKYYLFLT